jgi:acyl-CoA synthetase (AMP-forming)/AMP-acid ligase II
VEAVLSEVAGGRHTIVLGVPDADRGQAVAGVVITEDVVDAEALRRAVAEKLSSYKVPRKIIGMPQPEIPLLSSGKIDMRKLMEMVQGR